MANAIWHPGMRGFPWFTKYASDGNREVWSVTIGEDLAIRDHGTIIQGAVWESAAHMQAFYDTYYREGDEGANRNNGNHEVATGFIRWSHKGEWGFKTWEEAMDWVAQRETNR